MQQLNTPILFIIFNRTDTSLQVLQSIREAKPKRLYFFADGPRLDVDGEKERCERARNLKDLVDWPCEVRTFYLDENLGPRLALGRGINWFFENEEEGIILEHDCLPSHSFYSFCETLLEHYRHDERIMHISGDNFQMGIKRGNGSYYFSKFNHIWGFATWKRAWKYYDVEMNAYPEFIKQKQLQNIFSDKRMKHFWEKIFDDTYKKKIQTWDYQWTFAMWCQNGLAILPQVNLISNIGFDHFALNTVDSAHELADMKRQDIDTIVHPEFMIHDLQADKYSINNVFYPSMIKYTQRKFLGLIGK